MSFGFTHYGRFSGYCRRLFGEAPQDDPGAGLGRTALDDEHQSLAQF